jgi:hypothetical protein
VSRWYADKAREGAQKKYACSRFARYVRCVMGMYASLFLLSDDNLRRVVADPSLFDRTFFDALPGKPKSLWSRWFGKPARTAPSLVLGEHEGEFEGLDKAWHGLHYLLTGSASEGEPPLNLLLTADGGVELEGSLFTDYGPPRLYFSDFASRAHQALSALRDDELIGRYPGEMQRLEIYPSYGEAPDDGAEYLLGHLRTLREFLRKAASHQLGIVVHLC